MAFTKPSPKKHDTPEWLHFQHTMRKMMLHLGKDALIYAQSALTHEDDEPERLRTFWENARKFFDDYEAPKPKAILKAEKPEPEIAPAVPEAKEGS
jgi:hypothetical protein